MLKSKKDKKVKQTRHEKCTPIPYSGPTCIRLDVHLGSAAVGRVDPSVPKRGAVDVWMVEILQQILLNFQITFWQLCAGKYFQSWKLAFWISGWLFQCLNRIISFDAFLLQTNMTTLKFVFSFLAFCVFFQRWTRGGMTQLQRGRGDALTNCGISYVPMFLCSYVPMYVPMFCP